MGVVSAMRDYQTLKVSFDSDICFIQINRPDANNTINDLMVAEFSDVLKACEQSAKIVVIEGHPEVFCYGADFNAIQEGVAQNADHREQDPGPLYDVWQKLSVGPFISIAHVKGKANAGGVGFVAAADIVICDRSATFSLSELLFGLIPACVMPFLVRRIGFSKANYMTLMTQPISASQAKEFGLVDVCDERSDDALRRHLLRLRRLGKTGIARYKNYMAKVNGDTQRLREPAIATNIEVFSDKENLDKITRFAKTGQFPWE